MSTVTSKYSTARGRWSGVGPYYAMFPSAFCDRVIQTYTREGDWVLDPFAGRGTALFSAASLERRAVGIEINPVGWVYAATKLNPAPGDEVIARLSELGLLAEHYTGASAGLPSFFSHCYSDRVLRFLITARENLDWRRTIVDRTVMALLLINLHGKRKDSLSNQMRQTKAMAPKYAVRWWKEHSLRPRSFDPVEYMKRKVEWRYAKGVPTLAESSVYLGDSCQKIKNLPVKQGSVKLLLTSPPYIGITNYHYDQWLRLWLLGGRPDDRVVQGKHRGKFSNPTHYEKLLERVFSATIPLLAEDAIVYVRTDRRFETATITRNILRKLLPNHSLSQTRHPVKAPTQTALFGHFAPKIGELDLLFRPS